MPVEQPLAALAGAARGHTRVGALPPAYLAALLHGTGRGRCVVERTRAAAHGSHAQKAGGGQQEVPELLSII
eukprot:COSAG02_NODE_28_length_51367_cov_70.053932_9_plen_72_part_00